MSPSAQGITGDVIVHLTVHEQGQLGLNIATYAQGQGGALDDNSQSQHGTLNFA